MTLSVVRIGGPSDGLTDALRAALIGHYAAAAAAAATATTVTATATATALATAAAAAATGTNSDRPQQHHEQQDRIISVSNPYFTARVEFRDAIAPGGEQPSDSTSTTSTSDAKEDGIILVFDSTPTAPSSDGGASEGATGPPSPPRRGSFDSLGPIHASAERETRAGDLLRLCVGVTRTPQQATAAATTTAAASASAARAVPAPTTDEREYSRRVLWCLDRGYEYVEVDLSEEGVRRGRDDREKEGFARVVEAIDGTVWSSAVMHPRKQNQLAQSYRQTAQRIATTATNPSAVADADAKTSTTTTTTTTISESPVDLSNENDQEAEEAVRTMLQQQRRRNEEEDDGASDVNDDEGGGDGARHERVLEHFEGAIRRAKDIRELSLSGALSDEERRNRAADAALALMSLMGQMGTDEDDEENDVESSSDGGGGGDGDRVE